LLVDGFSGSSWYVGPQRGGVSGAVITDWVAYTPTLTNLGNATINTSNTKWRRVGSNAEIEAHIIIGSTLPTGTLEVSLPAGLTPSYTSSSTVTDSVAKAANGISGGAHLGTVRYDYTLKTFDFLGDDELQFWNATVPFTWIAGHVLRFHASVPILGWSSNTVMSEDAGNKEIAASISDVNTSFTVPISANSSANATFSTFATKNYDTAGMTTLNSTTPIVIPESGIYDIDFGYAFYGEYHSTSGFFQCGIFVNGVDLGVATSFNHMMNTPSDWKNNSKSMQLKVNKGDTLKMAFWTDGSINADTIVYYRYLKIAKRSSPQTIAASEKVYAYATSTSGQGIPAGTFTTVIFNHVIKDTHGAYNPSTGVFTAPRHGFYKITFSSQFADADVPSITEGRIGLGIVSNAYHGVVFGAIRLYLGNPSGTESAGYTTSTTIEMNKGQTLTCKVYHENSGGYTLNLANTDRVVLTIVSE